MITYKNLQFPYYFSMSLFFYFTKWLIPLSHLFGRRWRIRLFHFFFLFLDLICEFHAVSLGLHLFILFIFLIILIFWCFLQWTTWIQRWNRDKEHTAVNSIIRHSRCPPSKPLERFIDSTNRSIIHQCFLVADNRALNVPNKLMRKCMLEPLRICQSLAQSQTEYFDRLVSVFIYICIILLQLFDENNVSAKKKVAILWSLGWKNVPLTQHDLRKQKIITAFVSFLPFPFFLSLDFFLSSSSLSFFPFLSSILPLSFLAFRFLSLSFFDFSIAKRMVENCDYQ